MAEAQVELINKFYTAFSNLDAETMASCYHEDVVFEDPGFGVLEGVHAGNMWRMLLSRAKNFSIEFSNVTSDGETGTAHWDARYDFGPKGRKVLNKIDATFKFKDGLIVDHRDKFDVWTWSKQAMGMPGLLFGWSGPFKKTVIKTSKGMLAKYEAKLESK